MNTQKNQTSNEEAQQSFDQLPGLGYLNDDIQAQLTETAKSITQDIIDLLSMQYKKARSLNTLPEGMWKPLRGYAYEVAAEHCDNLAKDLREAAKDPHMRF